MSRHRAVKNLDLDEELDDQAIDYGGQDYDDDMTEEQAAQMASALSAVQHVLGPTTTITDKEIKDALWDSYFDVDGTVAYLLDEQHKKQAAKAKAQDATSASKDPPTESLAAMSINQSPSTEQTLPQLHSPATANRSKGKLAAKMAANKTARMSKMSLANRNAPEEAPTAEQQQTTTVEEGGKKLSKLQQRMLASKAAKAAATSQRASSEQQSISTTSEYACESLQVQDTNQVPPSVPALLATPSPFASSLVTHRKPLLSSEADRIERSFVFESPAALPGASVQDNVRARFGPSPDDKVLEARKGTALGAKSQ
ncbi:hypothetical protein OIV83_005995 [Microbotryomycetes sp. JL201]|nr:hypothetical protein OIV83_005995 [Microbotryomycetes sp. JL201]